MGSKFTRRQWAGIFAALPVMAQSARPQEVSVSQDVDEAKARLSAASKELGAFAVPMNIEPSFQFKA